MLPHVRINHIRWEWPVVITCTDKHYQYCFVIWCLIFDLLTSMYTDYGKFYFVTTLCLYMYPLCPALASLAPCHFALPSLPSCPYLSLYPLGPAFVAFLYTYCALCILPLHPWCLASFMPFLLYLHILYLHPLCHSHPLYPVFVLLCILYPAFVCSLDTLHVQWATWQ